jgi:hypothetical protein
VTIREAEIALQAIGRIVIKTGSGVYVTDGKPAAPDTPPQVSAFELTEARSLFESEAAALAASTITPDTLARLDELLEIMGRDDSDDAASTAADQEFHLLIASASGNQAVIHVIKQLWRMRTEMPEVRTTYASCASMTVAPASANMPRSSTRCVPVTPVRHASRCASISTGCSKRYWTRPKSVRLANCAARPRKAANAS